ncbi:MAG: multidrug transporter [Erysipelotrichaceae bacterium]|nr:multidrug transporter [Erysipelotrichaceae bacterium]
MYQLSKKDWKLFREKLPNWQEHYMEQLIKGYLELLSSDGRASDRFWELDERIRTDRRHPGVIVEMSKSDAVFILARLYSDQVITDQDLEGFSQELIDKVRTLTEKD